MKLTLLLNIKRDGAHICKKGIFKLLYAVVEIILIVDPPSTNIILNIFPSTLDIICKGRFDPCIPLGSFSSWS